MAKEMESPKNGKETTKGKPAAPTGKPKSVKLVPPDGNWGWIIIIATSINLVKKNVKY